MRYILFVLLPMAWFWLGICRSASCNMVTPNEAHLIAANWTAMITFYTGGWNGPIEATIKVSINYFIYVFNIMHAWRGRKA